jgi:hypothetical protein
LKKEEGNPKRYSWGSLATRSKALFESANRKAANHRKNREIDSQLNIPDTRHLKTLLL